MITTNLRGTFVVLGQAARHISEGGRIIAFSSSVIAKSFPAYGPYIASKAGVEGLVHVLANELRGRNITVNAVAPGPVATELFLNGKTQEQIDNLSKLPPLERLGQPEDIANVVSFLAGPEGRLDQQPSLAREWRLRLSAAWASAYGRGSLLLAGFCVLFHAKTPRGVQSAGQHVLICLRQPDMGATHPSPAAGNGDKDFG